MPVLLQIDSCLGVGSTGRITESIGNLAMTCGWECYIAHGARYVGTTKMHSVPVVTKFGEYRHALKSMLFDRHGLGSVYETKQLIKKINEIKPDVIHLHCVHGYYLNYKVLFEYLNKDIERPEGKIIKVIKRIAFGFRSFRRFKARIMICKGLIKIKKTANV